MSTQIDPLDLADREKIETPRVSIRLHEGISGPNNHDTVYIVAMQGILRGYESRDLKKEIVALELLLKVITEHIKGEIAWREEDI